MIRAVSAVLALCAVSAFSSAQPPVWDAEFGTDGGFDGVIEFQNGDPNKEMLNPGGASGGVLQVQLQDGRDYGGVHDKGGRPLGSTLNPFTTSFSGYYKFSWSQLAETSADLGTFAGFLGDSQVHTSREALGSVMRHRKVDGNYEVNIGGFYGGVGINYAGYKGGTFVNLGPNAVGTPYQFVVSYDGSTHVLRAALYDAGGGVIADNTGDLDSADDYPNLHLLGESTHDAELNATQIKYLGWQDYVWNLNQQTIVWDVDRVAYFDNANGAFSLVPEPATLLLLTYGVLPLGRRRRAQKT